MSASKPHSDHLTALDDVFDVAMQSSGLPFNERVNLRTAYHSASRGLLEQLSIQNEVSLQHEASAARLEREKHDLEEQLEVFLDAAWKFEHEMASGEFVHFGEFRRALVAASGTDRASNPAGSHED